MAKSKKVSGGSKPLKKPLKKTTKVEGEKRLPPRKKIQKATQPSTITSSTPTAIGVAPLSVDTTAPTVPIKVGPAEAIARRALASTNLVRGLPVPMSAKVIKQIEDEVGQTEKEIVDVCGKEVARVHDSTEVVYDVPAKAIPALTAKLIERSKGLALAKAPHLEVKALAGTGKTTTVVEGMANAKGVPTTVTPSSQQAAVWEQMKLGKSDSIRFCAFGNAIAKTLGFKLADRGMDKRGCEASTFHKLGYRAVIKQFGYREPNGFATEELVGRLLGVNIKDYKAEKPEHRQLVTAVRQLVGYCKQGLVEPLPENLDQICDYYDVDVDPQRDKIYQLIPDLLIMARTPVPGLPISFDDMIWLPVVLNLPIYKVDMQIIDECVPGWTPVMMANGSSKQIKDVAVGEVVRSYDTGRGQACNKPVTATQRIPNRKPILKVKVRHDHRTGTNTKSNQVTCTTDHKIWTTNRGWVEASSLLVGDQVVVETAAKTSQKGKISRVGRDKLSTIHVGNTKGTGVNGGQTASDFSRIRGGNGQPIPTPQKLLLEALGEGWEPEYVVATGLRHLGYPHCYKIDLAHPELKIAVELDGRSHRGREEEDKRKDTFLGTNGWTVFRLKNREVARDLVGAVERICPDSKHCPRPATVTSVEPSYITDFYVYDISVEDTHCFYANGILVHNCQDLNRMQQELAYRAGHRVIYVGDPHQAIFGFAGADSKSMSRMYDHLGGTGANGRGCNTLPLTVTRRCGKRIVEEAKRYVPEFEAHESNCEGQVSNARFPSRGRSATTPELPWEKTYGPMVEGGDMVLCRCNAPLVSQCFKFIGRGIPARILGRNIAEGLVGLVEKMKAQSVAQLIGKLGDWLSGEVEKEEAKRFPSESRIEGLHDKHDCILEFTTNRAEVSEVVGAINEVFTDDRQVDTITFSSIHRAKGLESEKVFLLKPTGVGPRRDKMKPWELEQEVNLDYVAVTRAIRSLTYVS